MNAVQKGIGLTVIIFVLPILFLILFLVINFFAGIFRKYVKSSEKKCDEVSLKNNQSKNNNVQQHQEATNRFGHDVSEINEDIIYAIIAQELESGLTDKGLWTRL